MVKNRLCVTVMKFRHFPSELFLVKNATARNGYAVSVANSITIDRITVRRIADA